MSHQELVDVDGEEAAAVLVEVCKPLMRVVVVVLVIADLAAAAAAAAARGDKAVGQAGRRRRRVKAGMLRELTSEVRVRETSGEGAL